MRKNFGKQNWVYPMHVLIVASYDENGVPNALNAAWGGIYGAGQVHVFLTEHKTTENILKSKAFTVSFADVAHMAAADYVGIVSGNDVHNKLEKAGFHTKKSSFVNAPIIEELPMTLECKLDKVNEDGNIIGEIVNVSVDDRFLDEEGNPDLDKLNLMLFDTVHAEYRAFGPKVGNAFNDGKKLM